VRLGSLNERPPAGIAENELGLEPLLALLLLVESAALVKCVIRDAREEVGSASERELFRPTQRSNKPLIPVDVGIFGEIDDDPYPVVERTAHHLAPEILGELEKERAPREEYHPIYQREAVYLVRSSCEQNPSEHILLV
jgi:hypothetical protein